MIHDTSTNILCLFSLHHLPSTMISSDGALGSSVRRNNEGKKGCQREEPLPNTTLFYFPSTSKKKRSLLLSFQR